MLHPSGETSSLEQLREQVEVNENLRRQLREIKIQLADSQGHLRKKDMKQAILHWQLIEQNRQEENSQIQLTHFLEQLREKELQEASLHEQLREKNQQQAMSQRQIKEIGQELTNCQGQLREKELEEANLFGRLRDKEQQEGNLQRQLREMEQQLEMMEQQIMAKDRELENSERVSREMEQQLTHCQGQLREKELEKANLHEQLREKDRQQENSQRQLQEMESQLAILEGQFQTENSNLQQQVIVLEEQLRARDRYVNEMETTISAARQALIEHRRQQSPDWVIPRDQIQLTNKVLGRGGWGSVVEGKYCGCAVAVKQIHELILSVHNRNLFEREMDIASRCRHPCLLQFIGATNDEGNPLFVTELMESSLRALLEQRPLSATEVSVISLDVARALSYLHHKTHPIIHRDISSANVLLWRQGDQWRGKVSDYGTANFIQHTMTIGPGATIYMAPEARTSNQTIKVSVIYYKIYSSSKPCCAW